MSSTRRFYLVSLGCAKNTVDSTGMAALLQRAGYRGTDRPERADLLIVNTCGFIAPARDEAIETLRELAAHKRPRQALVAAGCLAQLDPQALLEAVPAIDGIISTRRWMDIVTLVEQLQQRPRSHAPIIHRPDVPTVGQALDLPAVAVSGCSAYLKVADGCRRACAFCAIPLIKGRGVSRPFEALVADAIYLRDQGVQEIVLIGQDTTDYGSDLGLQEGLAQLLERLVEAVPEVPWLRLMYAYPGYVTPRSIETMAHHTQILPYLDIPLQHAHPDVLRRMRRPADPDWVRQTLTRMRAAMPGVAVRTTFIVGYPGETEEEFRALLNFVEELRFDRVGVFTYWHEPGTPSAQLADDVPPEVKEERRERLMALQQPISLALNRQQVGRTLDVLVEGQNEDVSVGRSYRDAPEIDGLVLVQGVLPVGALSPVRITQGLEYDLVGVPVVPESPRLPSEPHS